ncbi:hypothetical protein ACW9JE_15075, partial [Pseudomonas sp. SDO55104_S430]
MDTPDNRAGTSTGNPGNDNPEQGFEHLKEDLTHTLGSARQQADAQFGQYRDTAADQIDALAKGAKSFVSELEEHDTLGMSDYLSDMAQSMSGLARLQRLICPAGSELRDARQVRLKRCRALCGEGGPVARGLAPVGLRSSPIFW